MKTLQMTSYPVCGKPECMAGKSQLGANDVTPTAIYISFVMLLS